MIRGYFSESEGINRSFIRCLVDFPSAPNAKVIAPEFLIGVTQLKADSRSLWERLRVRASPSTE